MKAARAARQIFSLIEMLIVVCILFVLLSLAFPSISSILTKGRTSICLGNLKQIYLLETLYMDDFGGLVTPVFTDYFNQGGYNSAWCNLLAYFYIDSSWPTRKDQYKTKFFSPFYCPETEASTKFNNAIFLEFPFGANSRAEGPFNYYPDHPSFAGPQFPFHKVAPDTILFADTEAVHAPTLNEDSNPGKDFMVLNPSEYNYARHDYPGLNFLFANGNAKHHPLGVVRKKRINRYED